jgi:hypothetical protein
MMFLDCPAHLDHERNVRCGLPAEIRYRFTTEPETSRPNTAPAYYLGHPARLWIAVMRPRRRRAVPVTACASARPTRTARGSR